MKSSNIRWLVVLAVLAIGGWVLPAQAELEDRSGPIVRQSVRHSTSAPLRDLDREPRKPFEGEVREVNPVGALPKTRRSGLSSGSERMPAPYPPEPAPEPMQSFRGMDRISNALPPDTVGDVGPVYYVQATNSTYAVFNKATGAIALGPFDNNALWSGAGGNCEVTNDGDPIVLYDNANGRWMISQFSLTFPDNFPPTPGSFEQCIAVSATGDPTGSWHRYEFHWSDTVLNDYPHFGIWPDGLYMAVNQFDGASFAWRGQGVAAFEWDEMLKGNAATMVQFDLYAHDDFYGAQIPVDWDGADSPPPAGRPALFVEWEDADWAVGNPDHNQTADQLWIWEFAVDWDTPANSTFGDGLDYNRALDTIDVDFDMCGGDRNCIPQPPPATSDMYLDSLGNRLMHRMPYRNMGSHEVLVGSHTVDADGTDHAGVHWFEVRDPYGTPFMQQDNVWAPDADHRWMGSIAMDKNGNIALGYSVSSTTTFPSIRYTGRMTDDPLGTLRAEQTAFAGGGSQLFYNPTTGSCCRWGDYSSMNVDPDDFTFWYTQEFYAATSQADWNTGIVAFAFDAADVIFSDGFESGDTSSWSSTTP